jgi:hypothetical protein
MRINQMPTVYFKGRVLPAPVQISFTDIPQVEKWVWQEAGMTLEFVIRITNSQVEVECKLDRYQNDYMGEIHRRAFDLARACVNVAAFSTGLGVIVFFDEFIGPDGVSHPLVLASPHVVAECTAFKMNPVTLEEKKNLGAILALVMLEPAIFMALNDLIQAISTPHMAPANCGRVLDGLRKLVCARYGSKAGMAHLSEGHQRRRTLFDLHIRTFQRASAWRAYPYRWPYYDGDFKKDMGNNEQVLGV